MRTHTGKRDSERERGTTNETGSPMNSQKLKELVHPPGRNSDHSFG